MKKIIFLFVCGLVIGCTAQLPIVEYQNVYIPVKCNITIPNEPNYTNYTNNSSVVYNVILLKQDDTIIREILNTCEGLKD